MHSSQFSFYFVFVRLFGDDGKQTNKHTHTHCAAMRTRMNVVEKKQRKNSFLFIFNWNRLTNRFTRHIFSYIFNVSFSATTNTHTLTHMQHTIRNESGNAVSRQHNFGLSYTRLDISNGCYTSWRIVWIDWKTIGMCSWQRRLDAHVCTEFLRRQRHCWCPGKYLLRRCMGLHWTPIIAVINVKFDKSHLIDFNKIKLDLSGSITSRSASSLSFRNWNRMHAIIVFFFFFQIHFSLHLLHARRRIHHPNIDSVGCRCSIGVQIQRQRRCLFRIVRWWCFKSRTSVRSIQYGPFVEIAVYFRVWKQRLRYGTFFRRLITLAYLHVWPT